MTTSMEERLTKIAGHAPLMGNIKAIEYSVALAFIQSECRAAEERARREFAKALLNRIDEYRDRSYEANTILEAVRAELFVRKERLADSLEI